MFAPQTRPLLNSHMRLASGQPPRPAARKRTPASAMSVRAVKEVAKSHGAKVARSRGEHAHPLRAALKKKNFKVRYGKNGL